MRRVRQIELGVILLFAVLLFNLFVSGMVPTNSAVQAETVTYTDVMTDLESAENFSKEDYPARNNDYSLQVISVAESVNGELFVYVYQPSDDRIDLPATSVRISTAINDNLYYRDYALELISTSGVFDKYLVKELSVKTDALRYYDIAAISRKWNKTIDRAAGNGNTTSEVAYEVGKLYTACTLEGKVTYTCLETESIVVTDKYVGYLRYANGTRADLGFLQWNTMNTGYTDSWFVAFSTDKPMDKLYEADVTYVSKSHAIVQVSGGVMGIGAVREERYGTAKTEGPVTLRYDQVASNLADGMFARQYSWNRIETTEHFIENESLTSETEQALRQKSWVLRFTETEHVIDHNNANNEYDTKITDVTILRLKYETGGEVYNLGVVDNKQSPAPNAKPGNTNTDELDLFGTGKDGYEMLVMIIALVVLLVIFAPLLPLLIRGIVFLVTLPFKLLGSIGKGEDDAED